jgi:hypothetical protein
MKTESCKPALHSFAEDVHMGECMKSLEIYTHDTRDIDPHSEYYHSEHFHAVDALTSLVYRKGAWGPSDWYVRYTRPYDLQVCALCVVCRVSCVVYGMCCAHAMVCRLG